MAVISAVIILNIGLLIDLLVKYVLKAWRVVLYYLDIGRKLILYF